MFDPELRLRCPDDRRGNILYGDGLDEIRASVAAVVVEVPGTDTDISVGAGSIGGGDIADQVEVQDCHGGAIIGGLRHKQQRISNVSGITAFECSVESSGYGRDDRRGVIFNGDGLDEIQARVAAVVAEVPGTDADISVGTVPSGVVTSLTRLRIQVCHGGAIIGGLRHKQQGISNVSGIAAFQCLVQCSGYGREIGAVYVFYGDGLDEIKLVLPQSSSKFQVRTRT